MSFTIREAEGRNWEPARLIQQCVLPGNHPYLYANNIGCSNCLNLVAEASGAVLGYISSLLTHAGGKSFWENLSPYIGFIGVLPEYQGQHIGTALLRETLHRIFARTMHRVSTLNAKPPIQTGTYSQALPS